jgi:hypothetical protein
MLVVLKSLVAKISRMWNGCDRRADGIAGTTVMITVI